MDTSERVTLAKRLMRRVEFSPNGCWHFTGSRNWRGYGQFQIKRKNIGAHRTAYRIFNGEIPDGLQIDHLCRVRHCVNPTHLEAVTQRENLMRGESPSAINAAKTHCIHGHPFSGENLQTVSTRHGRICRTCTIETKRRFRARQQSKAA